jgi:signal transduction histidine kinase
MSAIIDDLFDLARVRLGGGLAMEPQDADFQVTAQRVISEHQQAHPARTIDFRPEGDLKGCWDERRLEQVLSNLVANAERHGAADAPIVIRAAGTSDEVTFSVQNRGVIAADVLPVLFDPFRSGREKAARQGLGLGLFIVRHVVEAHEGSIEVTSSEEAGTMVSVRLPRRTVPDAGPLPRS